MEKSNFGLKLNIHREDLWRGRPQAHWGEITVYTVQYEVFTEHSVCADCTVQWKLFSVQFVHRLYLH